MFSQAYLNTFPGGPRQNKVEGHLRLDEWEMSQLIWWHVGCLHHTEKDRKRWSQTIIMLFNKVISWIIHGVSHPTERTYNPTGRIDGRCSRKPCLWADHFVLIDVLGYCSFTRIMHPICRQLISIRLIHKPWLHFDSLITNICLFFDAFTNGSRRSCRNAM